MKKIFLTNIICCLLFSIAMAQSTFQPKQIKPSNLGVVYDKEVTFDIRLHTHGLAFALNIGKIKTFYKTTYYHFGIGELKHAKEKRHSFDYPTFPNGKSSRSFVFGKRNSLYTLRGGWGTKRYYSDKAKEKGVAVGLSYEFGPSLGLLKPYYIEIDRSTDPTNAFTSTEKYSEENADAFLNVEKIYGSSGFAKGLGELSFLPGFHASGGVHIDWGAVDEFVKAIEVGIMIDTYLKKVPLMVENEEIQNAENRPFFINLYITLQLGKRWY